MSASRSAIVGDFHQNAFDSSVDGRSAFHLVALDIGAVLELNPTDKTHIAGDSYRCDAVMAADYGQVAFATCMVRPSEARDLDILSFMADCGGEREFSRRFEAVGKADNDSFILVRA